MTELKKLLIEFDILRQKNRGLSFNEQIKLLEQNLLDKYSVTLRNSDSSADNNKVEQLHSDEELMAKIEDMALILTDSFCGDYTIDDLKQTGRFETFQQQLKNLFKTHRNTVSTTVNKQYDKYSSRGETESKIAFKNSLRFSIGQMVTADQELDQIVENIVNFFVDTVNPVFRALNDSDEQSIIK